MASIEHWEPIADFPLYSVSDKGRVRRNSTGRILRPRLHRADYFDIKLYVEGKPKRVVIHRLVATTFLPASPGREFVNHIDGNKTNNAAVNLEWVTPSENVRHANRTGLNPVGERHRFAKLTESDVRFIRSSDLRHCDLAKMFGVASNTIYYARTGQNWKFLEATI